MVAVVLSSVSSFSLALVVIFDRLMVADCYRNRPDHAWLVSSLAGAGFGLVATALGWGVFALTTDNSIGSLAATAGSLWPTQGWLMIVAGALAVQVTRHYFRLFAPTNGGVAVNETAIAMWLASTPIFIYGSVAFLQAVGLNRGLLAGLDDANVSWTFGALVIITVVALLRFEVVSGDGEGEGSSLAHYTQIALLLGTTVAYTLILSAVLLPAETDIAAVIALLPLYWIGFAAGGRVLLVERERTEFRRNWRRVKRFILPIAVAEVFGMAMFFSEFLALGAADPTLVNLIISAHVLLVFLIVLRLAQVRNSMEANGVRRKWFLGVRLIQRRLPERTSPIGPQLRWLAVSAGGLLACIYLTSG